MGTCQDNFREAFAGESQASRRYLFFAERADKEGQPAVARLFRAAAYAETVHANNHLTTLGGIGTTLDNLKEAINGEHYEFSQMYPGFLAQAKTEGNKDAETTFDWANKVEKVHHALYSKALKAIEGGAPLKDEPYLVCDRCGFTVSGAAPEKCPVCGAARNKFKRVD
jgi:rubrerythrin